MSQENAVAEVLRTTQEGHMLLVWVRPGNQEALRQLCCLVETGKLIVEADVLSVLRLEVQPEHWSEGYSADIVVTATAMYSPGEAVAILSHLLAGARLVADFRAVDWAMLTQVGRGSEFIVTFRPESVQGLSVLREYQVADLISLPFDDDSRLAFVESHGAWPRQDSRRVRFGVTTAFVEQLKFSKDGARRLSIALAPFVETLVVALPLPY